MNNQDWIIIEGAREHNLKNVSVRIPRNRLTVVTGVSGSGKSSLAFDTLYAEGQRRYVESLSAYARQFLDQFQKPDADRIEGLSPAIAIEQRTAGSNPRSIVATATEIHDFLRLLFSSIGTAHCPKCRRPVQRQSAEQIVEQLMALPAQTRLSVLAPLVRGRKGRHEEIVESARKQGFLRIRVDGKVHEIESMPALEAGRAHNLELVVDRLVVGPTVRSRVNDSVETALRHGNGLLIGVWQSPGGAEKEAVFSERQACPDCAISFDDLTPRSFSFNSPYGACSTCAGLGTHRVFDAALVVPKPELSMEGGAIQAWRKGPRRLIIYYRHLLKSVAKHYGVGMDVPFHEIDEKVRRAILCGSGSESMEHGYLMRGAYRKREKAFEGVLPNLERRYRETKSEGVREKLRAYMNWEPCPDCRGARLKPEALACTIAGRSIADVMRLSVKECVAFFDALKLSDMQRHLVGDVLAEIRHRLGFLESVGLDYLSLDRESGTLAGGESQRIRLAGQIGSGLVGVLYVLDEPTIGLHARDTLRLIAILQRLRDMGNTVVVVEHDEQVIRAADYIVDLGPGAGVHGGRVLCMGTLPDVIGSEDSLTGQHFRDRAVAPLPKRRPAGRNAITVHGATENNLKDIQVRIPLGLLVCVTGVSGSGKSSLVDDILRKALVRRIYGGKERPGRHEKITGVENIDKVVVVDQSPIGRTPRSNPVTYTEAFTAIRNLFAGTPAARVRGYLTGRFSFNVKGGRCETCKGDGMIRLEMHFLPDVYVTCEQCRGLRYNRETLEVRYGGKHIAEVLAMTVDEALEFFRNIPAVARRLESLSKVGLGYLQLGQSATTLSGGEAQRVKLSAELSRTATGRTLYLMDEPTTGLHFADTRTLVGVLTALRDSGNTVVVIEHNLDVIKMADYIIDLGPEGGEGGGRVVACGTPEQVAACEASHTGQYLRHSLEFGGLPGGLETT
jgi:excinuclease ABC subunit A